MYSVTTFYCCFSNTCISLFKYFKLIKNLVLAYLNFLFVKFCILLRPPCKFAVTNCSLVTVSTFGFVTGTLWSTLLLSILIFALCMASIRSGLLLGPQIHKLFLS